MRLIRYTEGEGVRLGRLEDDRVLPLDGPLDALVPAGEPRSLGGLRLLPPVAPSKLVCVGLNYRLHAAESGSELPEEPMLFMCAPSAIVGDGDTIVLDSLDDRIDWEAELAVVVGRRGRRIPAARAAEHILGYTIANDVSNRHLQRRDGQFTRAKSFDSYKPVGPWIETDLDPSACAIRLWQNGEIRQDSSTADMIFDVPTLVEFVSGVMTLEPGDVIITGTPEGVGPMAPGDRIEIEIAGIGRLTNPVAAP